MNGFKETEGWQVFDMGPYPYLRFKISNNKVIEPQISLDGKIWCEAATTENLRRRTTRIESVG